jgi:hypothetical protein
MNALGHTVAAVPFIGPMAYELADKVTHGRKAEALGNLAGVLLMGKATDAAGAAGMKYLEEAPGRTWMDVLKPTAKQRARAAEIANGLAKRKVVTSDPRTDLVRLAEANADAIDTDAAVSANAPPGGLSVNDLTAGIEKVIQQQYNTIPIGRGEYQQVLKHPGNQALVDALGELKTTLSEHAPRGYITAEHALSLRRTWEDIAQRRKLYTQDSAGAAIESRAAKHGADSIRSELNNLPGVKDLNAEKHFWLRVKELAKNSPTRPTVGNLTPAELLLRPLVAHPVTAAVGGAVGSIVGSPKAGIIAATLIREAAKSPWWRTWKAAQQTRFVELAKAGRFGEAADMAIAASGTHAIGMPAASPTSDTN